MVTHITPAPTPNALHQRHWRERQKNPVHTVYPIEVERDAVRLALINSSYLSANEIPDRDCVAPALRGEIVEWVEHERHQHHP
jgi:hypothetical protein